MAKTRRRSPRPKPATPAAAPENLPLHKTRAGVLVASILVFALTIIGYSGNGLFQVIAILRDELFFVGVWVASATLLGLLLLRIVRLNISFDAGSAHTLKLPTAAGLGLGVYSLYGLALGLAGALNRWTSLLLPLGSTCIWAIVFYRTRQPLAPKPFARVEAWLRKPAGWATLWIAAMPFLAMAAVAATLPPGLLWPSDPHPYDVLEYHLQVPREWYEAHRIIPLSHNVFSYFPFNVEIQYLLFMHIRGGPWVPMYASQFLMLAYMVLMVLSVAGAARTPPAKAIAGVAAATTPWILMLGSVAYDEGGLLLYATLAIVWTLRALFPSPAMPDAPDEALNPHHPSRLRSLTLAGLFAGFACGVKLTAVPTLLIGLPLAAIAAIAFSPKRNPTQSITDHQSHLQLVRAFAIFFLTGLLCFSPWLIRNWRWSGNPVFPEAMSLLGRGHYSELQEKRWDLAHLPRPDQHSFAAHLQAAWKEIVLDWRYGYLLIPLALVISIVSFREPRTRLLLILLFFLALFWLGFTHLQSRFFVLAIPVAAMLVGQVTNLKLLRAGAITVLLAALGGWVGLPKPSSQDGLHPILHYKSNIAQQGIWHVDLTTLGPLLDEELASVTGPNDKLMLVGEARAYLYPLPMTQLRYRTVFDVDNADGRDLIRAWEGNADVPPGWRVATDSAELQRMRSYYGIHAPATEKNAPQRRILPPANPASRQ